MGENILGTRALNEAEYYNRAYGNEVWQCVLYSAASKYGKITGSREPHHVKQLMQYSRATPQRFQKLTSLNTDVTYFTNQALMPSIGHREQTKP